LYHTFSVPVKKTGADFRRKRIQNPNPRHARHASAARSDISKEDPIGSSFEVIYSEKRRFSERDIWKTTASDRFPSVCDRREQKVLPAPTPRGSS
jgi:hypothetical protein